MERSPGTTSIREAMERDPDTTSTREVQLCGIPFEVIELDANRIIFVGKDQCFYFDNHEVLSWYLRRFSEMYKDVKVKSFYDEIRDQLIISFEKPDWIDWGTLFLAKHSRLASPFADISIPMMEANA